MNGKRYEQKTLLTENVMNGNVMNGKCYECKTL